MTADNTPLNSEEALLADILTDVAKLDNRIKAWTDHVTETTQQAVTALETQIGTLLTTAADLQAKIKRDTEISTEKATAEVQAALADAVRKTTDKTIKDVVGAQVQALTQSVHDTTQFMQQETGQALVNVRKVSKTVTWVMWHRATLCFAGGVIGALTVIIMYEVARRV